MGKSDADADFDQIEHGDDQLPISSEHRAYLIQRHGTVNLDPCPQMDDNDPLNWPQSKKIINLALIAFHATMATFSAAAIQSAFVNIAEDLAVSVQRASYLTSLFIVVTGVAPLFWRPICQVYGRRPVFLVSLICSLAGNVGCAVSPSFATMALCRAITAFFICPPASIGSAVVSETFFRTDRARYMGVWTAMVTLGVPMAAFLFGFAVLRVGYRWIYWTLAITNGVQFILYLFLGPESRYVPSDEPAQSVNKASFKRQYLTFRRISPESITFWSFVSPLMLVSRPCVVIPGASHAMIFLWGSVLTTFEMPQIYPAKFGFNSQQVGLQFIGVLVGTIIGEQVGGILSDKWMAVAQRRGDGKRPSYEFRLWLSHIGFALTIAGTIMFLVTLSSATHWTVVPAVGAGISAGGNQIVTTIMITYAIDCYPPESAAVGVFIILVRQVWGFIGPFWIPQMITGLGLALSAAPATALIVGISVIPVICMQFSGQRWRR